MHLNNGMNFYPTFYFTYTNINLSNFLIKIKSLLLNAIGNEDNCLNVMYLIEYFKTLT